jgi:hypothetical protein
MRPVRIIVIVVFAAALAVTGCASRSADQTGASSSGASSVTTTQPTASSGSTTTTVARPATATCVVAPKTGPAGARVTLTCRGFAPAEQVDVTFGAVVVATDEATAGGEVLASFAVPSGFAGSHYPGRKDTFQAKGRQSGKMASATFTVTG